MKRIEFKLVSVEKKINMNQNNLRDSCVHNGLYIKISLQGPFIIHALYLPFAKTVEVAMLVFFFKCSGNYVPIHQLTVIHVHATIFIHST